MFDLQYLILLLIIIQRKELLQYLIKMFDLQYLIFAIIIIQRKEIFTILLNNVHMVSQRNCFGGVIVSMLSLNEVDFWFDLQSCQTKDYKIGIYCFSA